MKLYSRIIFLVLLSVLLAGCGQNAPAEKKIQVAVFYDAALNRQQEQYFDGIANALIAAQKLHPGKVEINHVRIPINDNSRENFIENQLAEFKYNLVIDTDVNYTNSIERCAEKYPKISFVIVDPGNVKRGKQKANLTWLVFDERQQGYVAGLMAALKKSGHIAHLDLCKDDVNPEYDQGIQAGIKAVNNGSSFSRLLVTPEMQQRKDLPGNDLYDRTLEAAKAAYKNGCDVIIGDWEIDQLAVLAAAREYKKFAVASDVTLRRVANTSSAGFLLGAVEKNYKLAINDTIAAKIDGVLKGGDIVYNLSNDGIIYKDPTIQDPSYQALISEVDKYVLKLKNDAYKIE